MKKAFAIVALIFAVAGIAYMAINQWAISKARQEHATLANASQEARLLAEQNQGLAQLQEQVAGMDALRRENAGLPGLRNEARQLRRKVEDLDKLRSENQRLQAALKQPVSAKVDAPLPEGFIPKAALVDAGLGTPEAAVQTMFWAAVQGDYERALQSLVEPETKGTREQWQASMGNKMSKFPGFRVSREERD